MKRFILIMLVLALAIAGIVSWFASTHPDGLERVAEDKAFLDEAGEPSYRLFPGYSIPGIGGFWSNMLAGIVGVLAVYGLTALLSRAIVRKKKQGGSHAPPSH